MMTWCGLVITSLSFVSFRFQKTVIANTQDIIYISQGFTSRSFGSLSSSSLRTSVKSSVSVSTPYSFTASTSTINNDQQSCLFNNNNTIQKRSYSSAEGDIIKVPSMGDSISEGTIVSWAKNVGDSVKVDDVLCSIETDKVTIDINAQDSGVLTEQFASNGQNVLVGTPLYRIKKGAVAAEAPKAAAPAPKAAEAPKAAAPAPKAAEAPKAAPAAAPAPKAAPVEAPKTVAPKTGDAPSERRVKMTRIRQRTAQRLKDSQNTAAMLTTFNEVDMSSLMELRTKYKDEFNEKHGVKLGFMSAFVKASTIALRDQPIVNASIDDSDIVYHDNININVAVAAPRGLQVPVIKNCQNMGFADIEKEIGRLGGLARNDQLAIEDSMGGTFTISNGGVYGSMFGTPIINPPQSAILGMHAVKDRPTVVNGQVVIRPIMYLALTYDHRIIDGREAVTFLKKIKDVIEDPQRLLLDI
ncbi:hypothetical protein SAMD00019534_048790 [Acytostelium subglobosum LB1]|uniref:hypothetical protein n=1 Tax=Acytostelium subglobosum LB1 TaxID=1410327 RepID=UPI000644B8CD|nr:hypothetical protein SAMD00019534_048790 [Acytostelium subglobosum LB1]GAM21704.1 hypothetical protein SAMD00019534_048790 [Acytostelium subglobosum LB1]|eukprot:XP_012755823.1 hypothetical protein SAMD00019534_048790 [Acytostelium subglobosum LB1]